MAENRNLGFPSWRLGHSMAHKSVGLGLGTFAEQGR